MFLCGRVVNRAMEMVPDAGIVPADHEGENVADALTLTY
jgi:hypothetical protein